jgi:HAD superfamily hydrolase (TIGR01490 family)
MIRPRRIAFFDVDGTIVSDKSLISFYRVHLERRYATGWEQKWREVSLEISRRMARDVDRAALNRWFYETYFSGLAIDSARAASRAWFERSVQRPGFFVGPVTRALRDHRATGFGIVLVSGSFREAVAPIAAWLGADHAIVAPLEEAGGRYTGRLTGEAMIGHGKANAVRRYLARINVAARECYAYGDDRSDIPFLESVGHPVAIAGGGATLVDYARARRWPVLTFDTPS